MPVIGAAPSMVAALAAALLGLGAGPGWQLDSARLRFTHYAQNGLGYQSAAGPPGGPGSERARIEQPQAEVIARLGDRIAQRIWVPIDVITAASPDHSRYGRPIDAPIDAVSTPSRINTAEALDTLTTFRATPQRELQFRAAFHVEEPFQSWVLGMGMNQSFAEDNTVLGVSVNQVVDWFDRFDLEGRRHGRTSRSTSNVNLMLSQVLSPTTFVTFAYGVTWQVGTLTNTWQSALLSDGTRGPEIGAPRTRPTRAERPAGPVAAVERRAQAVRRAATSTTGGSAPPAARPSWSSDSPRGYACARAIGATADNRRAVLHHRGQPGQPRVPHRRQRPRPLHLADGRRGGDGEPAPPGAAPRRGVRILLGGRTTCRPTSSHAPSASSSSASPQRF